jgi:hypothetical protein
MDDRIQTDDQLASGPRAPLDNPDPATVDRIKELVRTSTAQVAEFGSST